MRCALDSAQAKDSNNWTEAPVVKKTGQQGVRGASKRKTGGEGERDHLFSTGKGSKTGSVKGGGEGKEVKHDAK